MMTRMAPEQRTLTMIAERRATNVVRASLERAADKLANSRW